MTDSQYANILDNDYSYGRKIIEINGHQYYIQVPDEINENTVFYVAGRGAGGIGDTKITFQYANGKNVVIIAPVHEYETDFEYAYRVAQDIVNRNPNISEMNISFSGHSNSANLAMEAARNYCRNTGKTTALILNDPYGTNRGEVALPSNFDYSSLNGSLIVDVTSFKTTSFSFYSNTLKKAAAAGAEVLIVTYNSDIGSDHGVADDISAALGSYNISNFVILDEGQTITFTTSEGGQGHATCTYYVLDANGNKVQIDSNKAREIVSNAALNDAMSREYSFDKYGKEKDNFKTETVTKPSRYSDLKEIGNLSITFTAGSGIVSEETQSNMSYITTKVNEIRQAVRQSGFLQGVSSQTCRSSSGIPGCIGAYIDAYYEIMGQLMDLVVEQTEAVISYGQAYVDMDLDLKQQASNLGMEVEDAMLQGLLTGRLVEQEPITTFRQAPVAEEPEQDVSPAPTPDKTSTTDKPSQTYPTSSGPSTSTPTTPIQDTPVEEEPDKPEDTEHEDTPVDEEPEKPEDTSEDEEPETPEEDNPDNEEPEDSEEEETEDDSSENPGKKPNKKPTKTSGTGNKTTKTTEKKGEENQNPLTPTEVEPEPVEEIPEIPVEEPTQDIPVEPITPPVEEEPVVTPETTEKEGGKGLNVMLGAAAIGAGIGAIAYGVNEHIKNKEYEDGYDYSYGETPSNGFTEVEDDGEQYTPYVEAKKEEPKKDKVDDFFGE